MTDPITIFNRQAVRQHRARAASTFSQSDFLFREVAIRLLDRLDDVTKSFPVALDLGCRSGLLGELGQGKGGMEYLIGGDLSPMMPEHQVHETQTHKNQTYATFSVMDEETLPFAPSSLDLVMSNLSLHWVNDLPGAMAQICHALKPDGLFLATLFSGDTLQELRSVLGDAEIAVEGGLSPRVSPFADIKDAGALMQRAGFALPVVDTETITVSYSDPLKLMHDLRHMGEANAVVERRQSTSRRETMTTALQLYQDRYSDDDGRVPATFQVLYLSGWAPAPTQQQPLKPGQGEHSLKDFLRPS